MIPKAPSAADSAHDAGSNSSSPVHRQPSTAPAGRLTEAIPLWLESPLSQQAFTEGIAYLKNRDLSEQARFLALDKLHSWRRRLAPAELRLLLAEIELIASTDTEPLALRSRAVGAMATILVVMQEQDGITRAEVEAYFPFLTSLGEDVTENAAIRGNAIRALGTLRADEAGPMLRAMLATPENGGSPELIRSSCLALAAIEGEAAVAPIANVLATTANEAIFGTAAFALGQMHTPESLAALVRHEERFPNSGSVDAVLVNMEDLIIRILQDPADPNLDSAIRATQHLWKDGQRERYVPILQALLTTAPLAVQQVAVGRLIDIAQALPLEEEQMQLAAILPAISGKPELRDYILRIQNRLSAKPLVPNAPPISTSTRP